MEEERKHYRLLNTYVFSALSQIQLENLNPHYGENDVIPSYDAIPTYAHFDEAILHMKKDKTNLDKCLEDIMARLNEYNAAARQANSFINNRIDNMIHNAGFDANDANHIVNMTEIKRISMLFFKNRIFQSRDLYNAARDFEMNPEEKERHASIHDTIINIIRDEEIIKKMAPLKGLQSVLTTAFISIRNRAAPISNSITDSSYETRANCCPTYWSLIRRFI